MLSLRLQNGAQDTNKRRGRARAMRRAEPASCTMESPLDACIPVRSGCTDGAHADVAAEVLSLRRRHVTPVEDHRLPIARVLEPVDDFLRRVAVRVAWREAIPRRMHAAREGQRLYVPVRETSQAIEAQIAER